MNVAGALLSRLRRPEHTGENRCIPCTVVNVGVAALVSVAVGAAVWSVATSVSGGVAAFAAFGLCAVTIYLRGYLVPGTPTLTERYFPTRLLSAFGKEPAVPTVTDGGIDQEAVLTGVSALEEHPDGPDLRLTSEFRAAWYDAIDCADATGSGYEGLFEVLGREGDRISVAEHGTSLQAEIDGEFVGIWKCRAAFLADLGAARVLADRYEAWDGLEVGQRQDLLSGLRLFIDRCPTCGATPEFETEIVETCCAARNVVAVECAECGARLFESTAE